MGVRVADASAIGALLFGEPDAARVSSRLSGVRLISPTLLPFEVASICRKKVRLYPDLRVPLLAAYAMLPRMAIELVTVDQQDNLLLALETGLTVYDASYLWLAGNLKAELITLDKRLASAHAASM